MADIKIPEGELAVVLQKAILDSLSAKTKERLIEGALAYLITPNRDGHYGGVNKSPLQEQFQMALLSVAQKVAHEVIEQEGVRAKLVENFAALLRDIPDLDSDWDLQTAIFRAIIERANKIKESRY